MANSTVLHGYSIQQTVPPFSSNRCPVMLPGTFCNQHISLGISEDYMSKHTLLIGGTGCGKTNVFNFYLDQLKKNMTQDDVMIVFDTKGEFVRDFYRQGDIVIANSKQYSHIASKWNIYREIVIDGWGDTDIFANTQEITGSFFKESIERSNSPFFPNAARDLLSALIIAHIRLGKDDLEFKQKYFNNQALKKYLDMVTPKKINKLLSITPFSDLSSVLSYIGDGTSDQSLGVLAEMQNVIRQLFVGTFAADGRFSVRDFVKTKRAKTLFIEYDLSLGESLLPMYRVLFDLALKEAMGREKSKGNVYFVCDEFKLLPHLQHIEDGVNFGRSLGVKIFAGIQSINQLYEIYGQEKGKNIAAGFSSVYAFRANDSSTREFVTALFGKNIVLEQYKTATNTLVEEKREGHTVEDWDMGTLSIGEAIVGLPFEKPFRFKFDIFRR